MISEKNDRPYSNYLTAELIQIADNHWDSEQELRVLSLELENRHRKAARHLHLKIAQRIVELAAGRILQAQENSPPEIRGPLSLELYSWQRDALEAWELNNQTGIIEAVTGAGKTRVALAAIAQQLERDEKSVVIVPSKELLYQWRQAIQEMFSSARIGLFGDGHSDTADQCDILVSTVHSASRYYVAPQSSKPLLVADEVHRFAADTFRRALEIDFPKRLGLSATWERPDKKHLNALLPYFRKVIYSLTFEDAARENVIAPFRVATVGVELDAEEMEQYQAADEKVKRLTGKLINQFDAPAEPYEAFMQWVNEAKQGEIPGAEKIAGIYLSAVLKRQNVLAECTQKKEAVLNLLEPVNYSERTLCFTMRIQTADELARSWRREGIDAAPFHSDLDQHHRKQTMRHFREGNLKLLVAAKALDEGIDVPEADLAIIFATSASRIQLTQRYGRVLRKKPFNRTARIAHFYVRNTLEDPERGLHDAAFEDLRRAATEFEDFVYPRDFDEIIEFLSPD